MKRHRRDRKRTLRRELRLEELQGIVDRAKAGPLSEADHAALVQALQTLAFLTQELQAKGASLERLRRMLFGARTEKTSQVLGGDAVPAPGGAPGGEAEAAAPAPAGGGDTSGTPNGAAAPGAKRPGHGRNGAAAYTGAKKISVQHESLHKGDACPGCQKGKVYPLSMPSVLVRITGMAPLHANVYECEQLRCNLCGEVFVADAPAGVGTEKYDETAASMVGLLKYGAGMPFNRIEKLQGNLGIPLPAATQWEVVERAAGLLLPAHEELLDQAAQGELLHNDDTTAKILELMAEAEAEPADGQAEEERTGIFTTGIVAEREGHRIALFLTGRQHAGENLRDVLRRRRADLQAPIQMCDALSRNLPGELKTVLANCLVHARRRFVEVVDDFPDECRHLLEVLREVYKTDALAREQELSPEERLRLHQEQSGPRMADLEIWLREQIEQHKVEPNSGLGEAIGYMRKHWKPLTLFLREASAPLDNTICERALKKAILHRKIALFYKTQNGARVGDIFMSLIHTAELAHENPFDYLVALQRDHEQVAATPAEWLPWNYKDALVRLAKGPAPPGTGKASVG
jgi:transposase